MSGPDPHEHAFVRREIDFEDEPRAPEPARGASTTWILLAAGLVLSLLLFKFGIWFFFLPIVIPFGLGGRSFFGARSVRRRTIRLESDVLSVYTRSVFGYSAGGAIDVSAGVAVSVTAGAAGARGPGAATVRFVGAAGVLEVPCADSAGAWELERRVKAMLSEAQVPLTHE